MKRAIVLSLCLVLAACGGPRGPAAHAPDARPAAALPPGDVTSPNFADAHPVEDVFQSRGFAVGAVALGDEDAQDRVAHGDDVRFRHHRPGAAGEIAMAGDAAERQAEA